MRRAPLAILLILAGAGVAAADPPHTAVACTLRGAGGTCDHILTPTGFTRFNGLTANPPVGPGTRICLRAGSYPAGQLWLENLVGDAPDPVEVINCGGRFVISMPNATVGAMSFYGVRYLKLTGRGSPADHYGIHVAGAVSSGIVFQSLSSDMEVEYVEVSDAGFAGIMAKTDATCTDTDPLSFRGGFVQRNSVFHDNYIHDVEGEGFYIGYSFWQGRTQTCNGTPTLTYSHPLDGVRIYDNRLERTGCEAIQVGCAANTEVHGNYVKDFGVSPFAQFQNNGMQIGGGTSGRFYNNFIWNSDPTFEVGNGIFIQSYRDTLVAGNTLVNSDDGMYVHRDTGEDQLGQAQDHTLTVANNTVVLAPANTAGRGIWTFNDVIDVTLLNNLVVVGLPPAGVNEDLHVRRNAVYDQRTSAANQDQGLTGPNILQVNNVKSRSADALVHFRGRVVHGLPAAGRLPRGERGGGHHGPRPHGGHGRRPRQRQHARNPQDLRRRRRRGRFRAAARRARAALLHRRALPPLRHPPGRRSRRRAGLHAGPGEGLRGRGALRHPGRRARGGGEPDRGEPGRRRQLPPGSHRHPRAAGQCPQLPRAGHARQQRDRVAGQRRPAAGAVRPGHRQRARGDGRRRLLQLAQSSSPSTNHSSRRRSR